MNCEHTIYEKLLEVPVVDTHEHLWDESYRLEHPGDWTLLFWHYGITALTVAGMSAEESERLYGEDTTHEEKWAIFSRYFPLARNTAYIRAALIAIRDIYGIEEVTCESMRELTDRMRSAVTPGFHRRILRDIGNIDFCMVNSFDADEDGNRYPMRSWGDTDLLRPDLDVRSFIYPGGYDLLQRETGVDCSDLRGWLGAVDAYFEKHADQCCSIKIGLGYRGHLHFQEGVSFDYAKDLYWAHKLMPQEYDEVRPLVDFLFHHVLSRAADYHLPLKFHTGLYSGENNQNFPAISGNVRDLAALAMAHPECDFIAMHIAYPFQDQLVMAIKQITNLYADLSWSWIVDTEAAKIFLKQALTAAPINKITGFGGDYAFAENTYGHLQIARRAISQTFSALVSEGHFTLDEAHQAGEYILRESALRLYEKNGG